MLGRWMQAAKPDDNDFVLRLRMEADEIEARYTGKSLPCCMGSMYGIPLYNENPVVIDNWDGR